MPRLTDKELLVTPSDEDLLHIVDVSDLTGSLNGTSKKITRKELVKKGWSIEYYDSLNAAIVDIGDVDVTLLINKETALIADLVVPENVTLKFEKPGIISGNYTLTINGGIEAGLFQIFDSTVTVTGSPKIEAVYPEWFGAKGDRVTDDTSQINSAINLALSSYSPMYLSRWYLVAGSVIVSLPSNTETGISIRGAGRYMSGIVYNGATAIDVLSVSAIGYALNVNFDSFGIDVDGSAAGTVALRIADGVWRSRFSDMMITRDAIQTGYGIHIGNSSGSGNFDLKFSNLYIRNFDRNIYAVGDSVAGNHVTNLTISDSYISNANTNLYFDFTQGVTVTGTQLESALTEGAYFANCDTIIFFGGTIESPNVGAIGINMDANTKSVIALCDFYNNSGGNFLANGQMGHIYKSTSSGLILSSGGELRLDSDGTNFSKLRFLEDGVADVRVRVSDGGNGCSIVDSSNVEHFKFDVGNNILDIIQGYIRVNKDAGASDIKFRTGGLDYLITVGAGSPEGVVTANPGSLYLNINGGAGSTLYIKESGTGTNTGWIAK